MGPSTSDWARPFAKPLFVFMMLTQVCWFIMFGFLMLDEKTPIIVAMAIGAGWAASAGWMMITTSLWTDNKRLRTTVLMLGGEL